MLNKRYNPIDQCEIKFESGAEGVFTGYASVFNKVDSYGDIILPGAYSETLKNRKSPVKMFLHHRSDIVIGKWISLKEDEKGLFVKGELTPGHSVASDVFASLKHGAIDGLSIGYGIATGGAEDNDHGGQTLSNIKLHEVSVVAMPADGSARISGVKSIQKEIGDIETIRDLEIFLRDAGPLPRSMAKALISQIKPIYQREVEDEAERKAAMTEAKKWLQNLTK